MEKKILVEFEPKRPYRFFINFPKTMEIDVSAIKGMSELKYDFEKREWDDLVITIYDTIGQYNAQKLHETLVNTDLSKIKFDVSCLDPVATEIERFEIYGKLKTLSLGTYSYDVEDEIHLILLTIKPTHINFIDLKKHEQV